MTTEPTPPPVNEDRSRANPFRWGFAVLFVSLAVACLASALIFFSLYRQGMQTVANVGDLFGRPQPTPVLATETVILTQLRQASELATALYTMETVVTESQDRTLGTMVVGTIRLLYVAHGQVRAGVDLAKLGDDAAVVDGARVTVRLPPPEILDRKIDVERSYVYDVQRSIFGPVDPDLQSRAERYALDKILQGACEGGILEEANARAELTVRTLLAATSAGEVRVETQPPSPGSCPPEPPSDQLP